MELQEIHDGLLQMAHEGISHDSGDCQFCTKGIETAGEIKPEGAMDKTYTEDELKAEVNKALAAANEKFEEDLAAAKKKAAKKAADADAKDADDKDADDKANALQAQLDTAVLELEKVKTEYAELVAMIEEAKAEAERKAEIAERQESRLAKIKEVASFPDEYLMSNAERWAAMDDEAFEALCADYAQVSEKKEVETGARLPVETAMQTERMPKNTKPEPAYLAVLRSKLAGVDFSTL